MGFGWAFSLYNIDYVNGFELGEAPWTPSCSIHTLIAKTSVPAVHSWGATVWSAHGHSHDLSLFFLEGLQAGRFSSDFMILWDKSADCRAVIPTNILLADLAFVCFICKKWESILLVHCIIKFAICASWLYITDFSCFLLEVLALPLQCPHQLPFLKWHFIMIIILQWL